MPLPISKHTILLIQGTQSFDSRTFTDFPSVNDALKSLVVMYEDQLKRINPTVVNIHYTLDDIITWVNSLHDIVPLIFEQNINAYVAKDRGYIVNGLRRLFLKEAV
ncbi:hypothetical protein RCL1_000833 [Eukaryota sp. TZLM3-RCL]